MKMFSAMRGLCPDWGARDHNLPEQRVNHCGRPKVHHCGRLRAADIVWGIHIVLTTSAQTIFAAAGTRAVEG
jgi:hypothetical protein